MNVFAFVILLLIVSLLSGTVTKGSGLLLTFLKWLFGIGTGASVVMLGLLKVAIYHHNLILTRLMSSEQRDTVIRLGSRVRDLIVDIPMGNLGLCRSSQYCCHKCDRELINAW